MIKHGEFTKGLIDIGLPMSSVAKVIRLSKGGVAPEGADSESLEAFGFVAPTSRFRFGAGSLKELAGVKPELVILAKRTLELTTQDFVVFDGLRTEIEQRVLVKRGASKTMFSKHRVQKDGFGHALDLVPYVNGKPVWEWEPIYDIVCAVDQAATELGIADNIVWGGAWDRRLSDFGGDRLAYKKECQLYQQRHDGADFIDGPHFEWRD